MIKTEKVAEDEQKNTKREMIKKLKFLFYIIYVVREFSFRNKQSIANVKCLEPYICSRLCS